MQTVHMNPRSILLPNPPKCFKITDQESKKGPLCWSKLKEVTADIIGYEIKFMRKKQFPKNSSAPNISISEDFVTKIKLLTRFGCSPWSEKRKVRIISKNLPVLDITLSSWTHEKSYYRLIWKIPSVPEDVLRHEVEAEVENYSTMRFSSEVNLFAYYMRYYPADARINIRIRYETLDKTA